MNDLEIILKALREERDKHWPSDPVNATLRRIIESIEAYRSERCAVAQARSRLSTTGNQPYKGH